MDRNVVLIILDSVRKDFFDRYAVELSKRADLSFEQARAASAWSTPSHASMFTGRLPHQHGIHAYQRSFSRLSPDETFLARLEDYETIGISSNLFIGSTYGFDGLFDEFVDVNTMLRYPDSWDSLRASGPARYIEAVYRSLVSGKPKEYASNALSFVLQPRAESLPFPSPYDNGTVPTSRVARRRAEETDEPFFMFVNFMEAHQPLSPHLGLDRSLHSVPASWSSKDDFYRTKWDINARNRIEEHEAFLSNYRELYGAAVEYLDRKVSALVDAIQHSTDRETTFVVTSDHGENLGFEGDEYRFEHTGSLTEALLHVPLLVINAPTRVDETFDSYVSQTRMGDLLVGLAAGETPTVTDERIAAEVMGLSPGHSTLTDAERNELDRTIRAAYEGEDKFLWDSKGDSTRYRIDPGAPSAQELVEEAVSIPEWATALFDEPIAESRSAAIEAGGPTEEEVDDHTKSRLEDLGYL